MATFLFYLGLILIFFVSYKYLTNGTPSASASSSSTARVDSVSYDLSTARSSASRYASVPRSASQRPSRRSDGEGDDDDSYEEENA